MQTNVRNETKKLIQKLNSVAVIKITEIKLTNHISRLPGMKVFCKVLYCNQEHSNRCRNPDLNFSIFEIKLNESLEMQVQVFIKGLLVNEKFIGTYWLKAEDFEERVVKGQVKLDDNVVGSIDVVINTFSENPTVSTQSTCNSLDMRDEFFKDTSHLDLDFFKPMNLFTHFHGSQEKNSDLSFEEKSPQHIFEFIQKVSAKKTKLQSEKKSLETLSKALQSRSLNLSSQKKILQEESNQLKKEKEKIQSMISTLNHEFSTMKREQLKNKAHKTLINKSKSRLSSQLNRLSHQTQTLNQKHKPKYFQIPDPSQANKENLEYSVFGLSESVRPINSCESPVPEEYFLI